MRSRLCQTMAIAILAALLPASLALATAVIPVPFQLLQSGSATVSRTTAAHYVGNASFELNAMVAGAEAGVTMQATPYTYDGTIGEIQDLGFSYKSVAGNLPWLRLTYTSGATHYMAFAHATQTGSVTDWDAANATWEYGTWNGTDASSYVRTVGTITFSNLASQWPLASVDSIAIIQKGSGQSDVDGLYVAIAVVGTRTYGTIQDAIDVAANGATVSVNPGTYEENLTIDHGVILQSAQGAASTFIAAPQYGGTHPTQTCAVTVTGSSVTINGFTIENSEATTGITLAGAGNDTVENNVITQLGYGADPTCGILIGSATSPIVDVTIQGNQIKGIQVPSSDLYGVRVESRTDQLTLDGNTLSSLEGAGARYVLAGILLDAETPSGQVTDNTITSLQNPGGSSTGVVITAREGSDAGTLGLHGNSFDYVTYGVENVGSGTVPATGNDWGSANGPATQTAPENTFNVGSQGCRVSGGVSYVPWLDGANGASFAPVILNGSTTGSTSQYASIGAAITAAGLLGEEASIICAAGTFTEDVTIDVQGLDLHGAGAATIIQNATQGDPCIDVEAPWVTLHGLTLENPPATESQHPLGELAVGADDLVVYGVTFEGTTVADFADLSPCVVVDGDLSGITLHDNTFTTAGTRTYGYAGVVVEEGASAGDVRIEKNHFEGEVYSAIALFDANATIVGNTIETTMGNGLALWPAEGGVPFAGIAVQMNGHAVAVTLSGNTVEGSASSSGFAAGIDLEAGSSGTLDGITFTGNTVGPYNKAGLCAAGALGGSGVDAEENNIAGNTAYGVDASSVTGGDVDATQCWWGDPSGPYNDPNNTSGQGNAVTAHVDFADWLSGSYSTGTPAITEASWFAADPNLAIGGAWGEFSLETTNPSDGATYTDAGYKITISGPSGATIAPDMLRLQYETGGTWTDVTLTQSNSSTLVGSVPSATIAVPYDATISYRAAAQLGAVSGTYTLHVALDDLSSGDQQLAGFEKAFTVAENGMVTQETFPAGWNMLSVPLVGADPSLQTVFQDVTAAGQQILLYRWNGSTYSTPSQIDAVDPGDGYWLYLSAPVTINANGTPPAGNYTVPLNSVGWHQVSTPRWPIAWSSVTFANGTQTKSFADAVTAGWVSRYTFWYDPTTEGYQTLDTAAGGAMHPWKGYWIETLVDDLTMTLPLDSLYVPPTTVSSAVSPQAAPADLAPPPPPTLTVSPTTLQFGNSPNPVRDVHTTTFSVKGALASLVQAIKVEIYDQSGRLVYQSGEIQGTSVDWSTIDDYGQVLANGVYLYKMDALVNGNWVVSSVKKLAILR